MEIRRYLPGDDAALADVFVKAVRSTSTEDYSAEQIEVWASIAEDRRKWSKGLKGRIGFVAEQDAEALGYITFEPNGHIDHLFVAGRFQRRGVALALYRRVEREARGRALRRIFVEASVKARLFFESVGFSLITAQTVLCKGVPFVSYKMEMFL